MCVGSDLEGWHGGVHERARPGTIRYLRTGHCTDPPTSVPDIAQTLTPCPISGPHMAYSRAAG
eukprot:3224043-Rhodomonas_salina.2